MIVGLDSMPRALAFDLFADRMPVLTSMRERGCFGRLRSTDPPVTIPAWITMTSGVPPERLGIYGFRGRGRGSRKMRLVTRASVRPDRIWDTAAGAGLTSAVVSVPLTFPVDRTPEVTMTGCFMTPGPDSDWASPDGTAEELTRLFGPYLVDVDEFRIEDRAAVLDRCRRLTTQHFAIFRHLLDTRRPDFGMLVDLGPDRFHHAMLRHAMPSHPLHDPRDPMVEEAASYYALLDDEVGRTLEVAGKDAAVMVVSDHGVRPLSGSVCVNELLAREGYLTLDEKPTKPTPLSRCAVDWSRTLAWGEGGYHSRIFFNVAGREPGGIIAPGDLPARKARLARLLKDLRGPDGAPMETRVLDRDEIYGPDPEGYPPDLTVYWDGLSMRSAGTVGHGRVFIETNDTGPDDANHDPDGIFVMTGTDRRGEIEGLQIADVHGMAMEILGLRGI